MATILRGFNVVFDNILSRVLLSSSLSTPEMVACSTSVNLRNIAKNDT